ncbi:MAG: hypothetical protein LLG08_10500 [Actinomycetia bacterium]|nr:hypothetical protein [Actinomycetes bacterium]
MDSPRLVRILRIAAGTLACCCLLFLVLGGSLYYRSTTLPDIRVDQPAFRPAQTSVVYAADRSVLATWHAEQDRTVVAFDKMLPA